MTTDSLDACLHLVADRHRRHVIRHLRRDATGTTGFETLVDRVHERARESTDIPVRDREELAAELHHVHLPKLAAHGVVDFDHGSGAVSYQPDEQVETVLDSLPGELALPNT